MATESATKSAKTGAMGKTQLAALVATGGEVRRGSAYSGAFPVWQWQGFNQDGEFVAAVRWTAVRDYSISNPGWTVSDQPGVNR